MARKDSRSSSTDECEQHLSLIKYGSDTVPIVCFSSDTILFKGNKNARHIGEKYHLTFKMVHTECMLIKSLLSSYGFLEVHPSCPDFNVSWSNSHIKTGSLRGLSEYQRVNHFPKSFELTRKDRLYKNIQRMQQTKGEKLFNFIPHSFLIPAEYKEFCDEFRRWRGVWIVKPLALSRGRGIFIISRLDELPVEEPIIVSKYVDNPFLINGFKFDLRLYVAVTSFDPLVFYIYKEGLTRFATEKYTRGTRFLGNRCMHLTNYSVNRHNANYTRCFDPNVDDYGNKWSLSALFCYLQKHGCKTSPILARIKDIVIKSLISAELNIAAAFKTEVPHHGNCFELFGFDILIDEKLQPWLLEINFSPSLACDLPLDLKIKSKLIADLLTLTGIVAHDPLLLRFKQKRGISVEKYTSSNKHKTKGMSQEEKILQIVQEEQKRMGDFLCIFPTSTTWSTYGEFFEKQGYNYMLHKCLFPSVGKFVISGVCKNKLFSKCIKSQSSKQSSKLDSAKKAMLLAFNKSTTEESLLNSSASNDSTISKSSESALSKRSSQGASMSTLSTLDDYYTAESEINSEANNIIYLLKMDETLSQVQARRVFSLYLYKVGQRLDFIMKNNDELTRTEQLAGDFGQQMDLVMQFLIYAAGNLYFPVTIIKPDNNLELFEQGKIVIHQLNKFLESYDQETDRLEKISDNDDREYFVDKKIFNTFIQHARAVELEEVLIIVAKHHSTSWFLGSKTLANSASSYMNKMYSKDFRRFQRIFTRNQQSTVEPSTSVWDSCKSHPDLRRTASSPTAYSSQGAQGNTLRRAKSSIYRTVRAYNPKTVPQ
ncbi:Tubulin polyglutamylase ttll5 [Chamberlinius hualienensis]